MLIYTGNLDMQVVEATLMLFNVSSSVSVSGFHQPTTRNICIQQQLQSKAVTAAKLVLHLGL